MTLKKLLYSACNCPCNKPYCELSYIRVVMVNFVCRFGLAMVPGGLAKHEPVAVDGINIYNNVGGPHPISLKT